MSMSYSFIKESIKSLYKEGGISASDLEDFLAFKENNYILKHNIPAFLSFLNFLESSNNIFILNGFMGSGKTHTVNIFTDFVSDDVLVFKTTYGESVNLDDVLLSFFKDFSTYYSEKKIILPKIESNIFSEKINAYIKNCNKAMLFIFDFFEINTRSKESQKDILDFINFLSHFEKIKIVISSRTFRSDNLISDTGVVCHYLVQFSKEQMYDYLNNFSITGSKYEFDELYKLTRGHYILIELSVLIINLMHIPLGAFCSEYTKSARNFLEFIISKLFSFTSERFIKLLILLATVRHGLTREFLLSRDFTSEEDMIYLLQKHIIAENFGRYYMKDYIKAEYLKSFSAETKIQVHDYLVKLYDEELPLKPFDRELFLSRQTMRQEIAYHKEKIQKAHEELIKTGKVKTSETKDFNYLTYSKNSGYEKEQDKSQKNEKRYIQDLKKHTKIKRKGLELSGQDFRLLQAASSSDSAETKLREFVDLQARNMQNIFLEENPVSDKKDEVPNSIDDYIEIAKKYEAAYNFSSAILYYKKALSYNNDESFSEKEPVIYINLAVCNKKIQDYEEAVRMYEKAYSIYSGVSLKKALQILLNIAQIYNEAYKFDKVKETYERILYSTEENSPETTIKCYLGLSELEDNNLETENALKYAKMALTEAEKYSDVKLLTECYFKYALLLDDNNNLDMAQKYYLRCIQTSANVEENLFLSSAYSNLAGISHEHNNISAAKMYYELAVDADKQTNNYEALYYSYTKLAELNKKDFPQKHYEYLVKALGAAKRFDDISYAVSIYYEIGEYYFTSEDYKRALKSYILAKNLMPSHISEKMQKKINNGINRIKILLGDNEFLKLLNEIKKKK